MKWVGTCVDFPLIIPKNLITIFILCSSESERSMATLLLLHMTKLWRRWRWRKPSSEFVQSSMPMNKFGIFKEEYHDQQKRQKNQLFLFSQTHHHIMESPLSCEAYKKEKDYFFSKIRVCLVVSRTLLQNQREFNGRYGVLGGGWETEKLCFVVVCLVVLY